MSLTVYTIAQSDQWDTVVRSFKKHDVYWLSGYVKAFHIHGDGDPLLFYYESAETRGINVVMKRDVANDKNFIGKLPQGQFYDFASPYGYGGWIIEGNNPDEVFSEYFNWIIENGVISEFVRFHPIIQNHTICSSFYTVVQLGSVVHMDLSTPEVIWNNIISKNRNMIRKAIKNDIKIYNGRFPEIYESFRKIYEETMNRDNAEDYYFFKTPFYQSLLEDIPQNSQVFWAERYGQVIAASIMIYANGYMNYHLSGSLREFSSLAPSNLIIYEAALWGCANGYKTLFLGGGVGSDEDSLFKFKRSFYKGELNSFYIGKRIYREDIYSDLVQKRKNLQSSFFPLYRAQN